MAPKITIGIPAYNSENWLAETVDSILQQTMSDICIVISDNASTDRTADIARQYANDDSRVKYHRNPHNVGVFRNFDVTFELSSSRYFKWCAVGDRLHPQFLEYASAVLDRQEDVMLVYSRTRLIGSLAHQSDIQDVRLALEGPDPVARYAEYFSRTRLNSPFHGLIRAEALARTGLNKPFRGSDQCLVGALLLQGPFVQLPEELLFRRIERDTATAVSSAEELNAFFSVDLRKVSTFPVWKFEVQRFRDVIAAPLKIGQKMSLVMLLLRSLWWRRRALVREILSVIGPTN